MVQWFLGQATRSTSSECWIEQVNLTASQNASKLLEPLIESLNMGMVSTGKNLKFSHVLTRKTCDFTSQIMVSFKWTWCWLYSQRYGFWQQTSLVRQQTNKHLGFQLTLGCNQQKWSVQSWGSTGIYHDFAREKLGIRDLDGLSSNSIHFFMIFPLAKLTFSSASWTLWRLLPSPKWRTRHFCRCYPLVICYIAMERSTMLLMGKPWENGGLMGFNGI